MQQDTQDRSGSAAIAETAVACPACGGNRTSAFYDVPGVPTSSCLLFRTEAQASACPTGDILLAHCPDCGFIFNAAFDLSKTEYSSQYEETQGFSPTFNRFHIDLAQRLISRHGLAGKRVTEIGCGKGEFLLLLAQLGDVTGTGIDPSAIPERILGEPGADKVTLIPEMYSETHGSANADSVICKMTLEHIPEAMSFMSTIRASLERRPETLVFFQIPEAGRILRTCAFEDIYYEHCAYFTAGSLGRLFRRCGFDVLSVGTEYDDQYLTIEARPATTTPTSPLPEENDLADIATWVSDFRERVLREQDGWRARLSSARTAGETIALWGSGSKAVSFLTSMGVGDCIDAVVDINPNRQGCYMPITGQRIVSPAELAALKPDRVIVMNRIYVPEIKDDLAKLGLTATVEAL